MDADKLQELLQLTNYDTKETQFLVDGFENGFSIGYKGDEKVKMTSPNLKFWGIGNETILWNKIMKEVKLKQYAGQFKEIPFDYYIQ